jgi:hypothetical protein
LRKDLLAEGRSKPFDKSHQIVQTCLISEVLAGRRPPDNIPGERSAHIGARGPIGSEKLPQFPDDALPKFHG